MAKMKDPSRKSGGITVRSTRYTLDGDGCVECPEEHAVILEMTGWSRVAVDPPKSKPSGDGLENMGKDELLSLAESLGLDVTGRTSKLKLVSLIRGAQE